MSVNFFPRGLLLAASRGLRNFKSASIICGGRPPPQGFLTKKLRELFSNPSSKRLKDHPHAENSPTNEKMDSQDIFLYLLALQ